MYFRDCKTLSVFERKIPLTFSLEFRFDQDHAYEWSLLRGKLDSIFSLSASEIRPDKKDDL
jgi:hypothetical protein